MSDVNPIPDGFTRVTAHLIIDGAADAIEFYKKAFDAEELYRSPAPDGKRLLHASLKIGDSILMICDDFPEFGEVARNPKALGASSVTMHQYVTDADAVIEKAVAAGATVKMPIMDTFWGDRYGTISDPFGHDWSIATHIKDVTPEESAKAAEEYFKKNG